MTIKNIILILSTAAVFLATAALGDDPKKAVVGKWSDPDGAETIEYKADGTMTETLAGGDVVKGKYSFPDATHIKVEFEGPMAAMGPVVSPITIKGDEMDITGVDGSSVMHYKRAKSDDAK